ncbi:biotin-protein ligase [Cladochytrium replicatum]|nr:biotin-protein ligase [Cladochytrium replicatum]
MMTTRLNVLVYSGPGTARGPLEHTVVALRALLSSSYDVMTVQSLTLATEPWEETSALLVVPGGRDLPYVRDLTPTGATRRIREYVRSGGAYLGICAGAYFAAERVEFERGRDGYEVTGARELAFWPGTARGSAFPGFVYDSEDGARAVGLTLSGEIAAGEAGPRLDVYHNGGPYFVQDAAASSEVSTKTLASYTELPSNPPAIVECMFGKGRAILTGVHVEYDPVLAKSSSGKKIASDAVDRLQQSDMQRRALLRALLARLGLRLNVESAKAEDEGVFQEPRISPMIFCGGASLWTGEDSDVEGGVNTFSLKEYVPNQIVTTTDSTNDEGVSNTQQRVIYFAKDPSLLSSFDTPYFNIPSFFSHLKHLRDVRRRGGSWNCGSNILYGSVVDSTQTLLEKNSAFAKQLPEGVVCVGSHQVAGRGRGRNSWISQRGCLMFTMQIHHTGSRGMIFLQYIAGLAIARAVRRKPGYEDIPVHLKWPNDIYARAAQGPEGLRKIGGVLITSSYEGGTFTLLIGCGVNVANERPTVSLNELIRLHNQSRGTSLEELTMEEVLARTMIEFEEIYNEFAKTAADNALTPPFSPFLKDYYRYWLHSDQNVTVVNESGGRQNAIIVGIDDSGLLRAQTSSESGELTEVLLQPDGNSFDILNGLIKRKM